MSARRMGLAVHQQENVTVRVDQIHSGVAVSQILKTTTIGQEGGHHT